MPEPTPTTAGHHRRQPDRAADPDVPRRAPHPPGHGGPGPRRGTAARQPPRRRRLRRGGRPARRVLRRRSAPPSTCRWPSREPTSSGGCGRELCAIPYGETISYGELARRVGQPEGLPGRGSGQRAQPGGRHRPLPPGDRRRRLPRRLRRGTDRKVHLLGLERGRRSERPFGQRTAYRVGGGQGAGQGDGDGSGRLVARHAGHRRRGPDRRGGVSGTVGRGHPGRPAGPGGPGRLPGHVDQDRLPAVARHLRRRPLRGADHGRRPRLLGHGRSQPGVVEPEIPVRVPVGLRRRRCAGHLHGDGRFGTGGHLPALHHRPGLVAVDDQPGQQRLVLRGRAGRCRLRPLGPADGAGPPRRLRRGGLPDPDHEPVGRFPRRPDGHRCHRRCLGGLVGRGRLPQVRRDHLVHGGRAGRRRTQLPRPDGSRSRKRRHDRRVPVRSGLAAAHVGRPEPDALLPGGDRHRQRHHPRRP